MIDIFLIAGGLLLLIIGGELLLRGAVGLASWFKLTPAVIGLTVVAAATSVPELAVSLIAASQGKTDIAVGNVVGSNICNIGLILGLSALIRGLSISGSAIKLEYPVMAIVSMVLLIVAQDSTIGRLDCILFVLIYICFTAFLIHLVRGKLNPLEAGGLTAEVESFEGHSPQLGKSIVLVTVSVVLLATGAHLTVEGAVGIARAIGLTERVIGLTIVAIGTSLPEVVSSLISSLRGRDDVAIGNVIGSNIFNILIILGVPGLIHPITIAPEIMHSDLWWMMGITFFLFPLMFTGKRITRLEGILLLIVFVTYLSLVLMKPN